jgi:hypothetical protein
MSDPTLVNPTLVNPALQSRPLEARRARRKGPLGLGLLLLLGGLGAGAVLFVNAGSQYKVAVSNLQRSPVGCDTGLNFTSTGTFSFYIETVGSVGDLGGDCVNANRSYARPPDAPLPVVALTLKDASGTEVRLERASGSSYDVGGYVGQAARRLTIDQPGQYRLSVESDANDFAIAIGRDPAGEYDNQRLVALVAALGGLVLGGGFTLLGLRRTVRGGGPAQAAAEVQQWWPDDDMQLLWRPASEPYVLEPQTPELQLANWPPPVWPPPTPPAH